MNETTTNIQVNEGVEKLAAGDFDGAFSLVQATVFSNTPCLHSNYALCQRGEAGKPRVGTWNGNSQRCCQAHAQ